MKIPTRDDYLEAKQIAEDCKRVTEEYEAAMRFAEKAAADGLLDHILEKKESETPQNKYKSVHEWWNSLPSRVEVTCDDMAYAMGWQYASDMGTAKIYNKMIRDLPGCDPKWTAQGYQVTKQTFTGKIRAVFITPKSLITTGENPATLKVVR